MFDSCRDKEFFHLFNAHGKLIQVTFYKFFLSCTQSTVHHSQKSQRGFWEWWTGTTEVGWFRENISVGNLNSILVIPLIPKMCLFKEIMGWNHNCLSRMHDCNNHWIDVSESFCFSSNTVRPWLFELGYFEFPIISNSKPFPSVMFFSDLLSPILNSWYFKLQYFSIPLRVWNGRVLLLLHYITIHNIWMFSFTECNKIYVLDTLIFFVYGQNF